MMDFKLHQTKLMMNKNTYTTHPRVWSFCNPPSTFGILLIFFVAILMIGCEEDPIEPESFGSVFGEVLDENNFPLQDVTVSTNPPTSTVLTDSLGRFAFENIRVATYTIRAEKETFTNALESVAVFKDQSSSVIIKLLPSTEDNQAPLSPALPVPELSAIEIPISTRLEWTVIDPDEDELTYEIHLFNDDQSMNQTVAGITENYLDVEDLSYGTVYFWQVTVSDGIAEEVNGPVWNFRTENFPDHRFLYAKKTGSSYDIFSSNQAFEGTMLTNNSAGSSYRPRMSPDRTRIAFISNEGIDNQLFVMKRNGTEITQVTSNIPIAGANNVDLDFAWSPDGTALLYMNFDELYRINIDGTGLNKIADATNGFTFTEVDWSGSSNKICARLTGNNPYNSVINIYDLEGNIQEQPVVDVQGSTGGGVLSIDGNYLLFTQDVSGFEAADGRQLDARIFLRNLSNGSEIDLSINKPAGTNDLDPRFSPDGSKVIFTNTNNDGISQKFIWIMTIEGEGRTLIFEDAEMPDWG